MNFEARSKNIGGEMVKVQEFGRDSENESPPPPYSPSPYQPLLAVPNDPPSGNPVAIKRLASIREIETLQMKIATELNELCEKTGMSVTQENGQRRLGPPKDHVGDPPPKGCEVFVGKVPRDVYEPEIMPVFEKIGKIYEMRLMMDFSGSNRGYCFVHYYSQEDANRAVRELNDYEIRKGRYLGVVKSVDNCRLFVGGLPKDKNEEDIFEEISKITEGVVKVIAYPSPADKSKNRGFAFVEYDSHKNAAMARRKMIPGKIPMWGVDVAVDWAEPEPNVDPEIMNKALTACSMILHDFFPDLFVVQNLYVRNLMLETTEDTLRDLFNQHSSNGVDKVKKIKDYAFIHFTSREQAEAAKEALDNSKIDDAIIEITWAKPVNKVAYKAQKALCKELFPSAGGRMNSRGRSGGRQPFGPNVQRMFGSHQGDIYPGPGLLPIPTNLQNGGHVIPQGLPYIPSGAMNYNAGAHRSITGGHPRPRAAAGVQGIRMPAQSQLQHFVNPQHPSREVVEYLSALGQHGPTVIADQYMNVHRFAQSHGAVYPVMPHPRVKQSIQDLFDLCARYGWGEPTYTTDSVKLGNVTYYSGACTIPHYPTGPKNCRCNDLFQDVDDARASAADMMLRVAQSEIAGVYMQQFPQMATHFPFPALGHAGQ